MIRLCLATKSQRCVTVRFGGNECLSWKLFNGKKETNAVDLRTEIASRSDIYSVFFKMIKLVI